MVLLQDIECLYYSLKVQSVNCEGGVHFIETFTTVGVMLDPVSYERGSYVGQIRHFSFVNDKRTSKICMVNDNSSSNETISKIFTKDITLFEQVKIRENISCRMTDKIARR